MDVMDPLTAPQLAEMLHEPNTALLAKVLRVLGPERCRAILTDALTTEASGGMLTKDGTRRRTPGGTFFHLVRDQCTQEERARLFPYVPSKTPPGPGQSAQPAPPVQPDAMPRALTLDLWKGLTPMPVTATLKLVLRDLPETRESGGLVYMAFQNEPRGLPKGLSLDRGPLYLSAPVKQWKTACSKAEQIRTAGTPALMIVEAHVSTKDGALVGVVKGVQVVEGKAPVPST
jgi:PHAX RNA-binding domain-containing protein